MLTPEADVQVNSSGGKQLRVKGVKCKNISHSDSSKQIPDEAVNTLSDMYKYTDLTLQMPNSASWNFDGNGTATTEVTFSAKGKSGNVKSTTKHGKFVVTQHIKIKHYTEADGPLPAQSTVYKKGNSTFEEEVIQQEKTFNTGKQISACAKVTQATLNTYNVSSLTDAQNVSNTAKWLSISCGKNWSLVVAKNESLLSETTSVITQNYTTSEGDIEAGATIYIGFYKQETTSTSANVDDFTYINSYKKKYTTSYTPDNNIFYPGTYCKDSGWYDANGLTANKDTKGEIYSEQPTAGSGFKFDSEEIFYVKTSEDSVANNTLCNVDNAGKVTFKKYADFENNTSYSKDGNPSFSVSFD